MMIVFDETSKNRVFQSLGLKINNDMELTDKNGSVLTNQSFEPVKAQEFGGVLTGSKVVIKNNSKELAKYFVKKTD